jgi:hypothetical protein
MAWNAGSDGLVLVGRLPAIYWDVKSVGSLWRRRCEPKRQPTPKQGYGGATGATSGDALTLELVHVMTHESQWSWLSHRISVLKLSNSFILKELARHHESATIFLYMCCNDGISLIIVSMALNLTLVCASNGDANELAYVRPGVPIFTCHMFST